MSECLTGKWTTRKFLPNWDHSVVFLYPHMWRYWRKSFPTFVQLFCLPFTQFLIFLLIIKRITVAWRYEFYFSVLKTIILFICCTIIKCFYHLKIKFKFLHHCLIFSIFFGRYGTPGSITKEYEEFSEYYCKSFAGKSALTIIQYTYCTRLHYKILVWCSKVHCHRKFS